MVTELLPSGLAASKKESERPESAKSDFLQLASLFRGASARNGRPQMRQTTGPLCAVINWTVRVGHALARVPQNRRTSSTNHRPKFVEVSRTASIFHPVGRSFLPTNIQLYVLSDLVVRGFIFATFSLF